MSALTDSQKIDALYQKFIVGATPARVPLVAPGPGVTPPPHPDWWKPTAEEDAAWATAHGLNPEDIMPWTFTPTGDVVKPSTNSFPLLPAINPDDVALDKEYAARGYAPDGVQRLSTDVGFSQARAKADQVARCNTAEEAEAALAGASYADADTVAYACMTGLVSFNVPGYEHMAGGNTIPDCAKTLLKTSPYVPGGPGPSGGA